MFILKHNATASGSNQTFKYSYSYEVLTSRSPPYQWLHDSNDSSLFFARLLFLSKCYSAIFCSSFVMNICSSSFVLGSSFFFCCSGYILKSFLCCQLALCVFRSLFFHIYEIRFCSLFEKCKKV